MNVLNIIGCIVLLALVGCSGGGGASSTLGSVFPSDPINTESGGSVWKPTGGLTGDRVNYLAIAPKNNHVIYAASSAGIFKSINAGVSWTHVSNWLQNSTTLTEKATGLTLGIRATAPVYSLSIDPSNNSVVYAVTYLGIFKTDDGGESWISVNDGLEKDSRFVLNDPITSQVTEETISVGALAIDPTNSQIVYCGNVNGSIYKTIDGGVNWVPASNGLTGGISNIAVDPTNSQIVYAGTYTQISNTSMVIAGSVFKSNNGGQRWVEIRSGINTTNTSLISLVINPSDSNVLYAGVTSANVYYSNNIAIGISSNYEDVYKSNDSGSTWFLTNYGMNGKGLLCLATDPSNSQVVYAMTYGSLYKSVNAGEKWIVINEGLPSDGASFIAIDPTNHQVIYAGTSLGVYKTTTGGI